MSENFIVSTGRSGSTILSKMVSQNRKVLVLSEFIAAMDQIYRLKPGMINGEELAAIMSTSCEISFLVKQRGQRIEEVLSDSTPTLAHIVLPPLTDDPEALFREMIGFARAQPSRQIADHYRIIFEWMCGLFGRTMWIERSGMTMRVFKELRRQFPRARYLHISRDGAETALSMYNHPWFRVAINYDFAPPSEADIEQAIISGSLAADDPVGRYFAGGIPVSRFGQHWSNVVCGAYCEIVHLNADQFLDLPFESLMADPGTALLRLAAFFELPDDPGWIDRANALVRDKVKLRLPDIPTADQDALVQACLPGQILLGRSNPHRLDEAHRTLRAVFQRRSNSPPPDVVCVPAQQPQT